MVTDRLVPDLILAPDEERLLPDAAEGDVEIWQGNDGFEAYGYGAAGYHWVQFPGAAVFRFRSDESGVVAMPDAGVSPEGVEDAYRRGVLPLVLQLRGHEVLHASAVSTERGLVVLCGVSGVGKSTFAHRLSLRGYPVWADDAVALDIGQEDIAAFRVPFRLGLRPDVAPLHTGEANDRVEGDAPPARSSVLALLILERSDVIDGLVEVIRLPPAKAFTELLPHAYYFRLSDPARNAVLVSRYMQLASSVPTFDISYRPGLGHIDPMLDEIEACSWAAA